MALVLKSMYRVINDMKGGDGFTFIRLEPTKIIINIDEIGCNFVDPRNEEHGFYLVGSPFPVLAVVIGYVYFVKVLGPKFMENRQPYDLTRIIYIYNLFQVISNIVIGSMVSRMAERVDSK